MPSTPPPRGRAPRPLGELASAAHGELRGPAWRAADPSTGVGRVEPDLFRLRAGDLFVALPGAVVDGHDLVALAAMRGAVGAVVSRSWADAVTAVPLPLVVVADPLTAVGLMASAWRARLGGSVVGITGSVGKSSTKEVLAAGLAPCRRVTATEANRNTGLGVALTLLDARLDDEVVILEVAGGSHADEIADSCGVARPDIGVVTSVHAVHLAQMGSVEAIAASKADLVRSVPPGGAVVLNADCADVRAMAAFARAPVRWFGRGPDADVAAESVRDLGLAGTELVVRVGRVRHLVMVPFLGAHAVEVVLAAVAVAEVLGVAPADALAGMPDAAPSLRPRLVPGPRGCVVVDDAYSASPPSVRSALELVGGLSGRRRIAVLGDMRELGYLTTAVHEELGRFAAARLDALVTVGEAAAVLGRAASAARASLRVTSLPQDAVAEVLEALDAELGEAAVILVKGSRAMRLERVVDALRA